MYKTFIYDEFSPEDVAMMQAFYSRSAQSVEEHVKKVKQSGSGKFMERYYVNYGHASIADCGSTTIFIENISILADKALQDWPLYSGQETSTRYINMAEREIIDPLKTDQSQKILKNWMDFYIYSQTPIEKYISEKYPRKIDEDESIYIKAVKARTFDILRSFLPAGITTQLSWHTNLRQAYDKLALLHHHPLEEARAVAENILNQLKNKYPSSFSHSTISEQEDYRKFLNQEFGYYFINNPVDFSFKTTIQKDELEKYQAVFDKRPPRSSLPYFLNELGQITFDFILDYGSFRDIQRHRSGICRIPLLTTQFGFNQWYLDQLPQDLKIKASELIEEQKKLIDLLNCSEEEKQYYIPLGFNVGVKMTFGLAGAVYTSELRSGRTVHPSLRRIAHQMSQAIMQEFPFLKLYSDLSLDDWDIRRGNQDIVEK